MLWYVFIFLLSAASAAPVGCTDQNIFVSKKWSMPMTTVTTQGYCHYVFSIPQDMFAVVDITVQNANRTDMYIDDGYSDHLPVVVWGYPPNVTRSVAVPTNFTISLDAPRPFQLSIKVTTKTAKPTSAGKITTNLNAASTLIYFQKWQQGTSYEITSLSPSGKVSLRAGLNYQVDQIDLENIFIYDGGELVGTLFTVQNTMNYVSKTNKLTIFMAVALPGDSGVIVITDYSDVERFYSYTVVYDERVRKGVSHNINGIADKPSAITLIGSSDGQYPFTLLVLANLDKLGGEFSYNSGGPIVTGRLQIADINMPKKLTNYWNTIYLSKGRGRVDYERGV